MADYFTHVSCTLPVGCAENVAPALALYRQFADELDDEDPAIGFLAEAAQGEGNEASLWLHDDAGDADVEHIIRYARLCAERFGLTGLWGFRFAHTCSRPRLDGFGGGAHVLDLGRRETVAWLDCDEWLAEQLAVREAQPAQAEALLQPVAAAQGWTPATQAAVLLRFIDGLIAPDPDVADRLQAHLAATSAEPEAMLCRYCGGPMFLTAEGTSHHVRSGMVDGIDHSRDRDHVAIADEEG